MPRMTSPAAPDDAPTPGAEGPSPETRRPETSASRHYRESRQNDVAGKEPPPERRMALPLILFIATCLSTFWVGCAKYKPLEGMGNYQMMAHTISTNWQEGLIYMGAVLAILLTHEMGHFVMTVRHRIPASYPLCIPVPINPIGTMGAVISMDGMKADRKQIFDIGIAGPLAGLVVAIPILYYGVQKLDLNQPIYPLEIQLNSPLIVQWMMQHLHKPEWVAKSQWIGISQVNPFYMAGWVGMLITGLNMLPISQLDGGHTLYGLFGRRSYTYARGFVIVAIAYVVIHLDQAAIWTPMLILVILMGIHHPPTANDKVELDDFRWLLGVASLSIPIICFPLLGLRT